MKIIPVGNDYSLAMKLKAVKAEKKEVVNGNNSKPATVSSEGVKSNEPGKTQGKIRSVKEKVSDKSEETEETTD